MEKTKKNLKKIKFLNTQKNTIENSRVFFRHIAIL